MPDTKNPQDENTTQSTDQNDDQSFTDLQSELEQTKSKLAELTTISQQALADLQNFKKRTEEEKNQFILFANATLIGQLIGILDNFDRALQNIPEDQNKQWADGIGAISKQFLETLHQNGLTEISAKESENFDPKFHEAVMTQPGVKDQILKEVEKGYLLGERILRRAKVIVGNGEAVS